MKTIRRTLTTALQTSTARRVLDNQRMAFLPKMFGTRYMMIGEANLYHFAGKLSPNYAGGPWQFYQFSDGGCYAAPSTPARLRFSSGISGAEVEISADAAGIIVSLFALGALAARAYDRNDEAGHDLLCVRYHQLREFALVHVERDAILAAID